MKIQRQELGFLKQWAGQKRRKPLIIRGARQVGKSTLARQFAEEASLNLVALNFERQPELADLFISNDPKKIISFLELQTKQAITPGKSLLFLDEIQTEAKILLPALRYFYEDMPDLHIIAAGSLLDFALKEAQFSMPVGRIEYLFLGPIRFEEFLSAMDEVMLLNFLKNYQLNEEFPAAIHNRLMELLRTYMIIGGMPEAIALFAERGSFMETDRVKHSILNTYREDFSKYTKPNEENRLRQVFNTLPSLIGNKLKYSHINPLETSVAVAKALEKLCLAGLIYLVKHSASNGLPLAAEVNHKIFKPLFLDVGLLSTCLGLNILDIAKPETIILINSGAIAEQFIGQHLLYSNPPYQEPQLYYWNREKKSSSAEVDYVISLGSKIFPIEVKAGKTGTLKSLHYFLQEKSLHIGLRFNAGIPQVSVHQTVLASGQDLNYQLLSLPLYFVGQAQRLLADMIKSQAL